MSSRRSLEALSNGSLRLYRDVDGCNTLAGASVDDAGSVDTATKRGDAVGAGSLGVEVAEGVDVALLEAGDPPGMGCEGSSETYDVRGEAPNQVAIPLRIDPLRAIEGLSFLGSGTDGGSLDDSAASTIASGSFVSSGSICWESIGGVEVGSVMTAPRGKSARVELTEAERPPGRYKLPIQLFRENGIGWAAAAGAAAEVATSRKDEEECLCDGPAPPIALTSSNRGFLVIAISG